MGRRIVKRRSVTWRAADAGWYQSVFQLEIAIRAFNAFEAGLTSRQKLPLTSTHFSGADDYFLGSIENDEKQTNWGGSWNGTTLKWPQKETRNKFIRITSIACVASVSDREFLRESWSLRKIMEEGGWASLFRNNLFWLQTNRPSFILLFEMWLL